VAVRCLIVDDNEHYGEAARALLEREGLSVVGVARSAEEGLRLAQELRPDLVLVDVDLGADDGFEVAKALTRAGDSSLRVILISTHDEHEFADLIEASPAVGFVPKARLSAALIHRLLQPGQALG
jgi:DNA-binding NarL/FixJ family response regulator